MEANTKQQQLLFDKGITNVPSDNLCSDNTLAESVGMVYDDGEHRVIQEPVVFISKFVWRSTDPEITGCKLLYIHKFNDNARYICTMQHTDGQSTYDVVVWGIKDGEAIRIQDSLASDDAQPSPHLLPYDSSMKITSVGKTLVISKGSDGLFYYLWKEGSYKKLAYPFPDIDLDVKLVTKDDYIVENSGDHSDILYRELLTEDNEQHWGLRFEDSGQDKYNDFVVGLYSKNKKEIRESKRFCEPFLIRAALQMYDDTYIYITNPILLFPSFSANTHLYYQSKGDVVKTQSAALLFKQKADYEDYDDIIKDVVIFATREVPIYKTSADQVLVNIGYDEHAVVANAVSSTSSIGLSEYRDIAGEEHREASPTGEYKCILYKCLKERELSDILKDLESSSVFYKLCSIGKKRILTYTDIGTKVQDYVIENLEVQEQLENDDYYSRCKLCSNFIYSYNGRLNISGIKRGMFEGFHFFLPLDNASPQTYTFFVNIETDSGNFWVRHTASTIFPKQGIFFYYPDSRAKHVYIAKGQDGSCDLVCNQVLKEHTGLNGAYYLKELSSGSDFDEVVVGTIVINTSGGTFTVGYDTYSYNNNAMESLPNYIIQSIVDNPLVFPVEGYHRVGTGNVIGMSSVTQALSEGQFGIYPLLAFSDNGIWALSVADTGYYSSIHPMSREVCNNAKSIIQTDGAVFFTSEKGLMVVAGGQVKCVSGQLSGKQDAWANSMYGVTEPTFPNCAMGNVTSFFRNCHIAYDYRDSLLWIFSNSYAANYCYIYSIKSGVFSKYKLPAPSLNCVNNYPDYLIQVYSTGKVYSLLERPDINYDTKTETVGSVEVSNPIRYPATMLTRPMKLENALALKSIMHLNNIKLFSAYEVITDTTTTPYTMTEQKATVKLRIFASNNLESWVEIGSLRGVPWKFYRFRYDFENLIATDRFAGTVLVTQERRTDKIR